MGDKDNRMKSNSEVLKYVVKRFNLDLNKEELLNHVILCYIKDKV